MLYKKNHLLKSFNIFEIQATLYINRLDRFLQFCERMNNPKSDIVNDHPYRYDLLNNKPSHTLTSTKLPGEKQRQLFPRTKIIPSLILSPLHKKSTFEGQARYTRIKFAHQDQFAPTRRIGTSHLYAH